jgi:UDP-glucose 4-epimerase
VNISSETVPGFFFPEREFLPDYVPVDEEHPIRPQDPYATAKFFGELLMDAAVRRSDIRCISIRPSWVQHEGNYERNVGPWVRELPPDLSPNFLSYIDVYDLADAIVLAAESGLPGHEVFYIASPDSVGGHPFEEIVREYYGDAIEIRKPLPREDASGISIAKAERMLGYRPKRSWRDYLDGEGRLKR